MATTRTRTMAMAVGLRRVLAAVVLMVALTGGVSEGARSSGGVLLTDIKVLTLHQGRMTAGRRSSPIPQLQCVGGDACRGDLQPEVVQCYNQGSDGIDVQWKCTADLDDKCHFGKVTVSCEGFSHPDDPYILPGSCGLEYELKLTEKGRQFQRQQGGGGWSSPAYSTSWSSSSSSSSSSWGSVVWFIWLLVFGFILYSFLQTCFRPSVNSYYPAGPGVAPGDGTGHGSAPAPGFVPYTNPNVGGSGVGGGFWSGAALGGLLGSMFGRRNYGYGGYGYGGYGGYGYAPRPAYGWGGQSYGGSSWGSSASSSSTSSTTRTSEGYGGTRRR